MKDTACPADFFNTLRFQEINAIGFYVIRVF